MKARILRWWWMLRSRIRPRVVKCRFEVNDSGVSIVPPEGFVIHPGETVSFGVSIPPAYIMGVDLANPRVTGEQLDGSPADLRCSGVSVDMERKQSS